MAHGRGRVWAKRVALGVALVLLVGGGTAALNWTSLNARYAGHKFRSATTTDDRTHWATQLLALGEVQPLIEPFRSDDAAACEAVIAALRSHPTEHARAFLEGFGSFSDAGKLAALELVPDLAKGADAELTDRCRAAVKQGMTGSPDTKVRAIRLALRPEIAMKAEVAPLLQDPTAPVRRAAMLAVGPFQVNGPALVSDDALFRFLHDPDSEVRDLCESALLTRGFDGEQVQLARMLADPNPAERLALARALERPDVANPAPWLERLARDVEPSVRVAAARVAAERSLPEAVWRTRLAETDPDPTVRKLAGYYRGLSATPIRPVGFQPER